jgi:chromosome segregation ATPase
MSFATPEMTGTLELSQSTGVNATPVVNSQKSYAHVQGVRFPLLNSLPMHTNLHNSLAPCTGFPKTTSLEANHGIEIRSYQTDDESAPVTMKFNNSQDLAQMLFPTSANPNVNLDHVHAGMMNHTEAINSLVASADKSSSDAGARYNTLSSSLNAGHQTFHTALAHHTDVLQHLEDHRNQHDEGIRNHKENIEMSLAALQQQNIELEKHARQLKEQHSTLSSFKTLLQSQYDINANGISDMHKRVQSHAKEQDVHATALHNHMEVLNSHVGLLNAQDKSLGVHSEALANHRDKIQANCDDIDSHGQQMKSLNANFKALDTGMIHHTDVLSKVHGRQKESDQEMKSMAEQQTRIMETQSNINRNLTNLESYISKNNEKIEMLTNKATGADMKNEILKIKTAVNENANVLQTLFQDIQRRKA